MIAGPNTNIDVNDENGSNIPETEEISSETGHVVDPEPQKSTTLRCVMTTIPTFLIPPK